MQKLVVSSYLPVFLVIPLCRCQSCLLTPVKSVNAKVMGLYVMTLMLDLFSIIDSYRIAKKCWKEKTLANLAN